MMNNDRTVKLSPREVRALQRMSEERRTERTAQFMTWLIERVMVIEIIILITLLLASCNPYAELYPELFITATATAEASVTDTDTATPAPITCTVTTGAPVGYLNLRTGAGVQFSIIRVLAEGEILTVIKRGAWHEVTDAQGNHGYINSNYCKIGE